MVQGTLPMGVREALSQSTQTIATVGLGSYNARIEQFDRITNPKIRGTPVMVRRIQILQRALIVFGFIVSLSLLSSQSRSQETREKETVLSGNDELVRIYEPREFVGSNKIPLKYRLLKPLNYKPGKKYPLVLFLHGAGERGDDNLITLKHGAKDFADAKRREEFPCYVVVPQSPKDQKWSNVDWSKESSAQPEAASESMLTTKELLDDMVAICIIAEG